MELKEQIFSCAAQNVLNFLTNLLILYLVMSVGPKTISGMQTKHNHKFTKYQSIFACGIMQCGLGKDINAYLISKPFSLRSSKY